MKFLVYLRSLASRLFHHRRVENDMEEELRSHIQHRADDLEHSGLDRAEAERRARIEFGGREQYKEESYQALGGNFIATLVRDVRFSSRLTLCGYCGKSEMMKEPGENDRSQIKRPPAMPAAC